MNEAVHGNGEHLKGVEVLGQAEAELMGDEVAGNVVAVDPHAVVAYYQIRLIPGEDLVQLLSLPGQGAEEDGNAGSELGQEEPGGAVGGRIVLECYEIAFREFPLQKRQGIAAGANCDLVAPSY